MSGITAYQSGTCSAPMNSRPVDAQPAAQQPSNQPKPKTDSLQISEAAQAKLAADQAAQQQQQNSQLSDLDDGVKLQTANQALLAQGV